MQGRGIEPATIGLVMLAAVLGGLAFQIPVGWLSDRFDRLAVLVGLGIGLVGSAVALVYLPRTLPVILPAAACYGGFVSTLYPICVAHAHDRMTADRVVAVSGRLILLNGLGSVLGPLIGMGLMEGFGIDGVFYLTSAAAFLLALFGVTGSLTSRPPPHRERPFAILAPQAAVVAHDPRGS
jgi:MFS family permease